MVYQHLSAKVDENQSEKKGSAKKFSKKKNKKK